MINLNRNRRGLLFGIIGIAIVTILALLLAIAVALWRMSEWGAEALGNVTDSTITAVAESRQEAARVLEDAKATAAMTRDVAAQALAEPQAALQRAAQDAGQDATQILAEATSTLEQTRAQAAQVLAEPQAAVDRAVAAAGQQAARELVVASAAAGSAVSAKLESVSRAVTAVAGRDPKLWPAALPIRRVSFAESNAVAEYAYIAETDRFEVKDLRKRLVELGYLEQVIGERPGSFEALYRADRQLLLAASTRDGRLHIDVRDTPITAPTGAGP